MVEVTRAVIGFALGYLSILCFRAVVDVFKGGRNMKGPSND